MSNSLLIWKYAFQQLVLNIAKDLISFFLLFLRNHALSFSKARIYARILETCFCCSPLRGIHVTAHSRGWCLEPSKCKMILFVSPIPQWFPVCFQTHCECINGLISDCRTSHGTSSPRTLMINWKNKKGWCVSLATSWICVWMLTSRTKVCFWNMLLKLAKFVSFGV